MKLIYVANARIPTEKAHGIQIIKMCEAFLFRGMEVELVVPRRINKIKQDLFEYYGIEKIFKIRRLLCADLIFLKLGKFGFFVETISFLIFARIYLFFSARGGSVFGGKKYDILYTREQWCGLFFPVKSARDGSGEKNFVLEVHSLPGSVNFLYKKTWKKAKKIIVLTSFLKNELIEKGVDGGKILVCPDGVDLKKFDLNITKEDARKKLELPQDKKIAVYAGSFSAYSWKGVDIIFEAAKELKEVLFLCVGDIKHKDREDNVMVIGKKPYSLIPYYLKAADILLLPNKKGESISEKYTSPLKMFEYMTAKVPVIASDLPSIREILNEKNAVLIKPNSPNDMAYAIKLLLNNENLGRELANEAYKKVQEYSWEKRAQKILDFILTSEE